MKRIASIAIALFMVFALAACGVPKEKLEAVNTKMTELEGVFERFGEMIDELDGYQMGLVTAETRKDYNDISNTLDEYRDIIDNELNKKSEKEIDEMISVLDSELKDAAEMMPLLETTMTSIASFLAVTTEINELNVRVMELSVMYTGVEPSQEVLDAEAAIGEKSVEIQGKLNGMTNFDEDDLEGMLEVFNEIEKDFVGYREDMKAFIGLMEKDLGIEE